MTFTYGYEGVPAEKPQPELRRRRERGEAARGGLQTLEFGKKNLTGSLSVLFPQP